MVNNDWQRIEDLFHEVIELPASDRAAYLSRVCGEDSYIRSEVEAYLVAYDSNPEIMEAPAYNLGLQALSKSASRPSLEGRQIGPYRIHRQLGEGGMGEVYLAEDTRLGRDVALKFLSQRLVNDTWARRQLKKEAQAVAKLDHPNICQVHGFEELDGHSFIVMQYIEGETLYGLVQKDSLPSEHVAKIARQIASALANAHAHGIIHRDIKPKNIMVSAGGHVKVLDFGLAKSAQQSAPNAEDGESQGSSQGLVVGTVKYMSPEQLKAENLDFRTDVFSFGVVLYEIITGRNPFAKDSDAETITAILGPDLPAETEGPKGLLQIARKCLIKDRERRYQSVSEILLDIEDYLKGKRKFRSRPFPSRLRARVLLAGLLLAVIVAAILYYNLTKVQTLAVMPVINKSGDQSINYLGDGLTDTLIHRLSRLPRLRVKPRTLVSGYKDKQIDPLEVGRALNAEMIFTAEITKRGAQPVLDFRLIRTKDGSLAWGETRNINPRELLSLHEELCAGIAGKALFYVRDSERNLLTARQTRNPEAFRHYFLGRHYWNMRDQEAENINRAINSFEQAIEQDPGYAQAYAGLADCYAVNVTVAYDPIPIKEAYSKAVDAAKKALELDEMLCEPHTSIAIIKLRYDWDYAETEKELKQAIRINPGYAPAHFWYSILLALMGRSAESIAESEITKELDPFSSQSDTNLGRAYYFAGQYDKALSYFAAILEKKPDSASPLYLTGLTYLKKGQYKEAIDSLERLYAKRKLYAAPALGYAYGRVGRTDEALKLLGELEAKSKLTHVPIQEMAVIHMGLNNKDKAFNLLQQACTDRFASFPFIKIDPLFDSLRSDPRFAELLRCANLLP
jgi:eukaryotic-like serine/threonine-protein kinase